jgi:hypothetical protein
LIFTFETTEEGLPPGHALAEQGLSLQPLLETQTLLGTEDTEDVFTR